MPSFKPIFLVIGVLLSVLSIAMLFPALLDYAVHHDEWKSFLLSSFITAFFGISLFLANRGDAMNLGIRQAFILTALSWLILVAFAALPFLFIGQELNYTNAFFEAMSGLTTTGATVMINLDTQPPGILLWRALLQWMGGVGIIVVAIAVLPMLRIGGMQLFRMESSDKSEKVLPRTAHIAGAISIVYLILTIACGISLWYAGMDIFDALCHAMTTVATAGFSTHDNSIAYFNSAAIEMIISLFMVLSSLPFVLYILMLRGRYTNIFKDSQVHWFLSILAVAIILAFCWLYYAEQFSMFNAMRYAIFNVISVTTTTGFSSADYYSWGGFAVTFLFMLSVTGGCTGSTTGGIKIFRYQILYQTAKIQIQELVQPHGVFRLQYNKKSVSEQISASVKSFFILFAFCFLILAVLLSATGLDYITSMSASAAALANLGPGLGDIIGPSGNYSTIPDIAKWLLSFAMLIGRLEIFTILVLFAPYFWKD